MDDPWGSPWTSADRNTDASPLPTNALSPFGTNLPLHAADKILPLPSQSPWADEADGFGGWAVADESAASPTPLSVSQGFPAGGISVSDQQFSTSATLSSGLISQPHPVHSISNHWSVDFTSAEDGFRLAKQPPSESGDTISALHTANGDEALQTGGRENGSDVVWDHSRDRDLNSNGAEALPDPNNSEAARKSLSSERGALGQHENEDRDQAQSESSIDGHEATSRHAPVEAAGTSNHEQVPPLETKALPNVQELVDLYDGLSQTSEPRSHKKSGGAEEDSEEILAESDERSSTADDSPHEESSLPNAANISINAESVSGSPSYTAEPDTADRGTLFEHAAGSDYHPIDKYGSIRFVLDEEKIGSLFGPEKASTPGGLDGAAEPVETRDSYVSDHIITDSFTSIGERKTWYRISRKGSYRKHNVEDDDSYVFVSWAGSVVRSETVQIVRRWMEEDSFTGKPVLGLSGTRGNLFGWDSVAKPLALNEVFKKASPISPASSPSISGHFRMSSSATDSRSRRVLSMDEASAPLKSPSEERTGAAKFIPIVGEASERNEVLADALHVADASTKKTDRAVPLNAEKEASGTVPSQWSGTLIMPGTKEDDEWGEMVSPTEKPSVAALANVLSVPSRSEPLQDMHKENGTPAARGSKSEHNVGKESTSQNKRDSSTTGTDSHHIRFGWENGLASPATTMSPETVFSPQMLDDKSLGGGKGLIQSIVYSLPDLSYMEK